MTNIYLSRLLLNPLNRDVRRDLSDCQELHRTTLSAFPQLVNDEKKAREEFGVLYRLDIERRHNKVSLLVQSHMKPDWTRLPDDYLLKDADLENPSCKLVNEIYNELKDGMRLRFRLRANPTRRLNIGLDEKETNQKRRGKRVDIRGEEEQVKWLKRKAQDCGFQLTALRLNSEVANVHAGPEHRVEGRKSKENKQMTFGSVLFDGELVITDSKQFQNALISGIGSGKAYGFGLLSIARA